MATIAPCNSRGVVLLGETAVLSQTLNTGEGMEEELSSSIVQMGGTFPGGVVKHSHVLGRPYGTTLPNSTGKSIHALRLTPELWTLSLPHRTQILFAADISMVVARLALRPGCVVVESGTGSGSLTHALARAVAPGGFVHTFEFNASRVEQARNEFAAHGLATVVKVAHRDVVANGFLADVRSGGKEGDCGKVGIGSEAGVSRGGAHALFLDVPNPWGAIGHAREALFLNGTLCSFSPCIEQVQKTSLVMEAEGFVDIRTFETLLRPWQWGVKRNVGVSGEGAAETSASRADKTVPPTAAESLNPSQYVPWPTVEELTASSTAAGGLSIQPSPSSRGHTGYLTFATKARH